MTKQKLKSRSRSVSEVKQDRAGLKGSRIRCKKGGAGGSFTWGRPGDEAFIPELTKGDPNYDSQEDDPNDFGMFSNTILRSGHDYSYLNYHTEEIHTPKLNLPEFKMVVAKLIDDLFNEGDHKEFLLQIQNLDSTLLHHELVKKLFTISMGKSDNERETVSNILIELQDYKLVSVNQIGRAFERLFESIEDLELDVPSARSVLAQFLARSVADEVLPPAFLTNTYIESIAEDIVEHAKTLLSIKHGKMKLERVWGFTSTASVDELKKEVRLILLEYMTSADLTEVEALIKKLNSPFFHHEIIKRGVVLALEKKEREQAMISILFKHLAKSEIVSKRQLMVGFQRLFQEIEDIKLDNPDAPQILNIFAEQAVKDGCFEQEELSNLKRRAREIAERERKLLDDALANGNGKLRAGSLPE